jgi:hypothetical protein
MDLSLKERQAIANKKYRDTHPNFYRDQYQKIKNNPDALIQKKANDKKHYEKNRDKILARLRENYHREKESDLAEFRDGAIVLDISEIFNDVI